MSRESVKVVLGVVLLLLIGAWWRATPSGLLGKADAVAYAFCHRLGTHSLHLGERPLPFCARCSGMYLGGLLALAYQARIAGRRGGFPTRGQMVVLSAFGLAFALDGVNSFLSAIPRMPTLYPPHNALRVVTGTGVGLLIGMALLPAFQQTVWRMWEARPILAGWPSFGGLLALAGLLVLALLSGIPLLLYPLALLSVLGVLVVLTIAYTLLIIMLLRKENNFVRLQSLMGYFMGGFALAWVQVILFDLARYLLTGTWEGFHLG